MKAAWLCPIIFQISFFTAKCEAEGARMAGMASAATALSGDVWTLFHNAGGLSALSSLQSGMSYTPGLFNLSELCIAEFALGLPTPAGSLGIALKKYGCGLYNELTCGVAYASTVLDFHFGLISWYHGINIAGYGSVGTILIDAGFLVNVSPELDIGLTLINISPPTIGESREKLPQTAASGIACRPVKNLTLTADLRKETMFPPEVRCGLEYYATACCVLRAGIGGEGANRSGGIGIIVSSFRFDYSISAHRSLGLTHVISMTFLKREK